MADDNNTVRQPFDFWPLFSDGSAFVEFEDDCNEPDNLVEAVLDEFGIPHTDIPGTSLPNLDIKQMDAYQVIRLSLMHASARDGKFYELTVNENGEVTYYELGDEDVASEIEKYHEFQTSQFREVCAGVMVTGAKPLVSRRAADFKFIWADSYRELFATPWMAGNCMSDTYAQHATIVFNDPHLETGWQDGIDNFYELRSPFENLIGYARYIDWPGADSSPDTTITRTTQATIPILVSDSDGDTYTADVGTLQKRPQFKTLEGVDPDCFAKKSGPIANFLDGVLIPVPPQFRYETIRGTVKDKLIQIYSIYVIGRRISRVEGIPKLPADAVKVDDQVDAEIRVAIDESQDEVFKLDEGTDYQIAFDNDTTGMYDTPRPYVVFADSSRPYDPGVYGNNVRFLIDKGCNFYTEVGVEEYVGTILPTGGTKGVLVKQVFALVELETPSIIVHDPRVTESADPTTGYFSKAYEIATNLEYKLAPLISYEPPAPIAFAGPGVESGEIIDQTDLEKDSDPTTQQNFTDTNFELRLQQMSGSGVTLSFSFIESDQELINLASVIFEQMNQGVGVTSTYVCGPDSTPRLGQRGEDAGTVVNAISFSYSDSNAYTISVNTGPRQVGNLAQISAAPVFKMAEDVSARGVVAEDFGDHIHYKVLVEGMHKPFLAINCAPKIIRVGDRVEVSLHNNPVED